VHAKKGIFGYKEGLTRLTTKPMSDWFEPSTFLIEAEGTLPEEETEKPYFLFGRVLVLLAIGIFAFRLSNLQITQGSENRYLAEGNRIRRQITVAPRGGIVDRKGNSLVLNEPGYSVDVIPSDLPRKKEDRNAVLQKLAQELGLSYDVLKKQIENAGLTSFDPLPIDPLPIQPDLTREQAIGYKVRLADIPGVRVSFQPTRRYDTTPGLSHLLGYTARMAESDITKHPDYHRASPIGRSGVESSYDDVLRGQEGMIEAEVNANGQFQRSLNNIPPHIGSQLRLTIDKGLQQEMAAALTEAMEKNGAKQAVGVALDPRDGGILASVSLPSYDNNQFARRITQQEFEVISQNPDKPLLNRAIDGQYPAGSTIKPFVALAALQEGTIKPNTTLDTSIGAIKIGQWVFPDWKVHGTTDVRQAIAESNDIFFYLEAGGTKYPH
jgi:penicillin-binding protein 2